MNTQQIAFISEVVYSNGKSYFSLFYPSDGKVSGCFTGLYEHHYWILVDNKIPNNGDRCMCGKREYVNNA